MESEAPKGKRGNAFSFIVTEIFALVSFVYDLHVTNIYKSSPRFCEGCKKVYGQQSTWDAEQCFS